MILGIGIPRPLGTIDGVNSSSAIIPGGDLGPLSHEPEGSYPLSSVGRSGHDVEVVLDRRR